ncbi:MAG: hypothetical protein ACR2KV_14370 [Solirubrobacteraceae bacterium]
MIDEKRKRAPTFEELMWASRSWLAANTSRIALPLAPPASTPGGCSVNVTEQPDGAWKAVALDGADWKVTVTHKSKAVAFGKAARQLRQHWS